MAGEPESRSSSSIFSAATTADAWSSPPISTSSQARPGRKSCLGGGAAHLGRKPVDQVDVDRLHRQRIVAQHHRHALSRRDRVAKAQHAQHPGRGQRGQRDRRLQRCRETTLTAAQQPGDVVAVFGQQPMQRVPGDLPGELPEPPPDHQLVPVDEGLHLPVQLALPARPAGELLAVPDGHPRCIGCRRRAARRATGRCPRSCPRQRSARRRRCSRSSRRASRGSPMTGRPRTPARAARPRPSRSVSTTPGSTTAVRASASMARIRLTCREASMTTPPIALPAIDVPPPRRATGAPAAAVSVTAVARSSRSAGTTTRSGTAR